MNAMNAMTAFFKHLDGMFLPPADLLRNLLDDVGRDDADQARSRPLADLLAAAGGRDNIDALACVGITRRRIAMRRPPDARQRIAMEAAARACGADATMWCSASVAHVIAGAGAAEMARLLGADILPGSQREMAKTSVV
jgi:phosphotransferase system IIB component